MNQVLNALASAFVQAAATAGAFFSFGPSSKPNNMREAGYDPVEDWLYAGGGITVQTRDDTPNLHMKRQETGPSQSGFGDNTTLFRFGAIPVGKNGQNLYDNQSDGEVANIAWRLHLPNDGNATAKAFSEIWLQVISDNDPNSVPFPVLKASGKGGGQVIFTYRKEDGTLVEQVKWKAP